MLDYVERSFIEKMKYDINQLICFAIIFDFSRLSNASPVLKSNKQPCKSLQPRQPGIGTHRIPRNVDWIIDRDTEHSRYSARLGRWVFPTHSSLEIEGTEHEDTLRLDLVFNTEREESLGGEFVIRATDFGPQPREQPIGLAIRAGNVRHVWDIGCPTLLHNYEIMNPNDPQVFPSPPSLIINLWGRVSQNLVRWDDNTGWITGNPAWTDSTKFILRVVEDHRFAGLDIDQLPMGLRNAIEESEEWWSSTIPRRLMPTQMVYEYLPPLHDLDQTWRRRHTFGITPLAAGISVAIPTGQYQILVPHSYPAYFTDVDYSTRLNTPPRPENPLSLEGPYVSGVWENALPAWALDPPAGLRTPDRNAFEPLPRLGPLFPPHSAGNST